MFCSSVRKNWNLFRKKSGNFIDIHVWEPCNMFTPYNSSILRVPSTTWKTWRYELYLSRSRNSLEISQNSNKTCTKQEIEQKTWIKPGLLKIHNISILYWDNFVEILCSCDFRTPLASTFWCRNCLQYNLENGFYLPGQNLECFR